MFGNAEVLKFEGAIAQKSRNDIRQLEQRYSALKTQSVDILSTTSRGVREI